MQVLALKAGSGPADDACLDLSALEDTRDADRMLNLCSLIAEQVLENKRGGWRLEDNQCHYSLQQGFLHCLLVMMLRKCGIDEWALRWFENSLTGRAQSIVISSTECSWRSAASSAPQGSCSVSKSMTWVKG